MNFNCGKLIKIFAVVTSVILFAMLLISFLDAVSYYSGYEEYYDGYGYVRYEREMPASNILLFFILNISNGSFFSKSIVAETHCKTD